MQISPTGLVLIKRFEGFSATPYHCPAGYRTIGYGHVITARDGDLNHVTEEKARRLLENDIRLAARAVSRLIATPLMQYQFDALVSFTFNLGSGALQRSRLRMVINRGEHQAAPGEFLCWVYAKGKKLPGLVARRRAEAEMYMDLG
jgi:lysozyme